MAGDDLSDSLAINTNNNSNSEISSSVCVAVCPQYAPKELTFVGNHLDNTLQGYIISLLRYPLGVY